MKVLIINILLQLSSIYVLGQDAKRTVFQHYEHTENLRPFLTRWYWTIRGETPYAWKETLLLLSDNSFLYKYESGDCGTFDHTGSGSWMMTRNELKLKPNNDCYMLDSAYIMNKGVLYSSNKRFNQPGAELKMK